ncbi:hypothetical protein PF008_g17452 [Phytophthora fragariae]|uniref:Secreted protein n=1 Tax=Phytophthora fragariae TaxID=53985 RepID=A0A6G0R874_9STRA|nr:hypothetical protein PF008_g17452 [Phytophthora fragariae]
MWCLSATPALARHRSRLLSLLALLQHCSSATTPHSMRHGRRPRSGAQRTARAKASATPAIFRVLAKTSWFWAAIGAAQFRTCGETTCARPR